MGLFIWTQYGTKLCRDAALAKRTSKKHLRSFATKHEASNTNEKKLKRNLKKFKKKFWGMVSSTTKVFFLTRSVPLSLFLEV